MKVWLPSHTLSTFARTISVRSAAIGLTTLALSGSLTSNSFGQFTAINSQAPDEEHSILVREGEQLDAVEPQQSGATPKPYRIGQQTGDHTTAAKTNNVTASTGGFISSGDRSDRAGWQSSSTSELSSNSLRDASKANQQADKFSAAAQTPAFAARQLPKPRRNEGIEPLPTESRTKTHQQAQRTDDVIIDRSVAPVSYAAPVQGFQNQNQTRRSMQPLQRRQNTGQSNAGQSNRNTSLGNETAQGAPQGQRNRSRKKTSASAKVLISRFGYKASQNSSDNLVPLRLADVLNQGQMRAKRRQLIDQYWETFADWAHSVSAKQHRDWVNGLRVSKSTDQSTVGVAKSSAENEVTANRIELGKSQAKLMAMLGSRASIVPADLPTVTMVKTNFQAFKERGLVPARLENIDQTLKDLHDLVLSRADTVLLAERTAEQVEGYYKSNRATIEQLLGAGRDWRSAEADFVDSAIQYNKAYADYALALPYGQAPVEQVVAMLVVPAKVAPTAADQYAGATSQRPQGSPTPTQPASSSRSVQQGRSGNSRSAGQDSGVRAASAANGFGQSRSAQSRQPRPMPDFSDSSPSDTSFATPKTPEFHPNSSATQPGNARARRNASAASASFGGGSVDSNIPARTRENEGAVADEFQSAGRTTSQGSAQPVSQPATRSPFSQGDSGFESGKKPDFGSSETSAKRSSVGFSSGGTNEARGAAADSFSDRPSVVRPATKPPVKPTTSFSFGGGTAGSEASTANAKNGFSTGFSK